MTSTVLPLVRRIAADVFGVAEDRIDSESSPQTIERWDSIQHLNFVLALEERFGFQLTPDDMDHMRTIGQVLAIVEQKTSGRGVKV